MDLTSDVLQAVAASLRSSAEGEPNPAEVVELLVANQAPLLSFTGGPGPTPEPVGRVLSSPAFAGAREAEKHLYDEAHGNFVRAAKAWESKGIQSICFKSAGIAPSYPYTSENFDILFRPADERGAAEALTDLGYVLLANCDEPGKWLYRLFVAGRSVSAIHLHTRVGWGQGFMLEDEIWRRAGPSADDPVTWVPGAEDVILINGAHAFFENKAFGLHDLMKIRHAIAAGADWDAVEHVARERGWLPALRFAMAMLGRLERRLFSQPVIPSSRFEEPIRDNPRMRVELERAGRDPAIMPFPTSWKLVKALFFDKIYRDRHEPVTTKPSLVFLTLARGLKSQLDARPQNSGLFTLSGVDGSGKTRQAEALEAAFHVCHLRRQIMWARLGATPVMFRLSRLWSKERSSSLLTGDAVEVPPAAPDRGRWPSLWEAGTDHSGGGAASRRGGDAALSVWAALSTVDFAVWLLRIRWRLLRGDIVIADRYVADYDVELSARLPGTPRVRRALVSLLRALAAKPGRAFLLDVDGGTARRRAVPDGSGFDPETVTRLYRDRASEFGLVAIDASQSFEAASTVVEREALRTYFNHYGMAGNSLYFQNPWQLNRPVRKQRTEVVGLPTLPVTSE